MSDLEDMQNQAEKVRQMYADFNAANMQSTWGGKEYAMGFVGDVGDLLKLVMAKENLRSADDVDAKLAHELSDCLWSVLVLANHYKVDLASEFEKTMTELEQRITA